ncbi:zinc ABC transporter substrate-binding protein ZnuA [Avibacterium sp. 21-595]|uniref:zinc ABC transporter substrate-binding protein ZnuA n=1 Tax=Avibacterium sp. 21-595 TaxID=2911527 RepID=UPI0020264437|nr:zinc ABC transporter substrate-binding protein ZnuA [Avibacterium sp. 21-595]URL07296.1 zinc ABC transporter substrate-binding protein ZnuA [Avibacterium sp. 21-595]
MTKLNPFFKQTAIAAALLSFSTLASASVVTSIKPLGFIASSIAEGVTDTQVLVPAGASPHDYNLKPSDVQKLKAANLVLWVGEDADAFLASSLKKYIDPEKVVTIATLPEITADMLEKGEHHHHHHHHDGEEHEHEHEHEHDHEHTADSDHHKHNDVHEHEHHHDNDENAHLETNWHIWYSPQISQVVAKDFAAKLIQQYPDKKALIEQNLAQFDRTLTAQNEKIKQQLAPVQKKGFYVFHDAYTYFNKAYGLNQVGAFTINPLVAPGAKKLAHIKEEIEEHKVGCLFAEPQFTPKVIETLHKSTGVNVGRLDPMGDAVSLGKDSYANFLQYTADSYYRCLK